ncbi:CPBP family intramembrane glutamic endopeptidase [Actinomadura opuntiae]|uniref:CPBP family intramembrane glutamic endopeptidase n=1 Tax=Actinomadura sp. OS1-43 TaxID=604315 RepID=UPI00255B227D|nr:CPBP family intramembrane glutamic endopeptidase [Actinomadura sp. OS1-43]MDL4820360.1 CPBP family intramembrane metalloprotease [Actinomadura sp. OS1-43]
MRISPDFSPLGLVLAVPLIGYVLAEGLWGKRSYDRMRQRRDQDPYALIGMFRRWISGSWWAAALAVLTLLVSPGVHLSDIGVRAPEEPSVAIGAVGAMVVALPLLAWLFYRSARAGRSPAKNSQIKEMLPRTSTERRYALAMAVTAGVTEELVYRGFLIALGVDVLGLSVTMAGALALALFTIGHVYQGWAGMVLVAAVGYSLTYLYLSSGSLLLPVCLHIFIDVLSMVVVPWATARTRNTDVVPV